MYIKSLRHFVFIYVIAFLALVPGIASLSQEKTTSEKGSSEKGSSYWKVGFSSGMGYNVLNFVSGNTSIPNNAFPIPEPGSEVSKSPLSITAPFFITAEYVFLKDTLSVLIENGLRAHVIGIKHPVSEYANSFVDYYLNIGLRSYYFTNSSWHLFITGGLFGELAMTHLFLGAVPTENNRQNLGSIAELGLEKVLSNWHISGSLRFTAPFFKHTSKDDPTVRVSMYTAPLELLINLSYSLK